MCGNHKTAFVDLETDFEKFFNIESKNRSAVRFDIADFVEFRVYFFYYNEVWSYDEHVNTSRRVVFFVDTAYFCGANEARLRSFICK